MQILSKPVLRVVAVAALAAATPASPLLALAPQQPSPAPTAPAGPTVKPPPDYVIGPEDVLGVMFWRDKDMTTDVTVRPDGKITLPLVGDLQAAGLSPEGLAQEITKAATKFIEAPSITVVVRQINSRKVFITGEVAHPGAYPLLAPMTVMQLIALAGGLSEYADKGSISILRVEAGRTLSFRFNYGDVSKGKHLAQNRSLKPGDTVVVP